MSWYRIRYFCRCLSRSREWSRGDCEQYLASWQAEKVTGGFGGNELPDSIFSPGLHNTWWFYFYLFCDLRLLTPIVHTRLWSLKHHIPASNPYKFQYCPPRSKCAPCFSRMHKALSLMMVYFVGKVKWYENFVWKKLAMNNNRIWNSYLWHLLLTWLNFNHGMNKKLHPLQSAWWNHSSIPKLQRYNRWSLGMDK